jgi:glycosyltransferase involved in cell wall biosynthesis
MKLLFYISSLGGGGAERVMAILCNKLSERGHEIYLAFDTNSVRVYELNNEVKQIHLSPKIVFKGITLLLYLKNIRCIAKRIKPDIIISFICETNARVLFSTLGLHIPVIASEHFAFDRKLSMKIRFIIYYVNRLASRVTVLTQYDYDFIGDRLKNKVVMPNPLPYTIHTGNNKRKKNILCAGSINRWRTKGFDNIIKIWGKISVSFPEWTLDICGNGTEENFDYLRRLALDYGISNTINFLGFRNDLDKLMQESSIFCLSSKTEGFAMVLLEAMSQGCACISFDCKSGPREIITHNNSGIIVKNQDMGEMGKALTRLMSDEKLRERLSIAGREEAKRFDANITVDKWEDLFNAVKSK